MIIGIGIDLVQCSRVERELNERPWQADDGVFTPEEIRSCGEGAWRAARLSGCFVAKEAALKAVGSEVTDLGLFRDIEVLYGPSGRPTIALHSRVQAKAQSLGVRHIWVSTASTKKHAGALVVLES
jgi:holo-[acyl-carrier protein] synthase